MTQNDVPLIQEGLRRYGWQSSVSIALLVSIGIVMHFTGVPFSTEDAQNVVIALPNLLLNSGLLQFFVGALFISAVVGIMLSTVDSFLATAVFVFVYDINPRTRAWIEEDQEHLKSIKNFQIDLNRSKLILQTSHKTAFAVITIGLALYFLLFILKIDLFGWLFFGFTLPLSLVPSVLASLILRECHNLKWVAISSIIIGIIASVVTFVKGVFNPDLSLLPPIITLIVSFLVFTIGYLIQHRKTIIKAFIFRMRRVRHGK